MNKNQQGFAVIEGLLILLILAVVGFGGYYVYHTQHKTTTTNSSTTANSTSNNSSTTNDYSGWNSYTDTSKLFSVMYPKDWTNTNPPVHADTPFTLADQNQSVFSALNPSNSSPTEIDVLAYSTSDLQSVYSKDSFGDKPTTPQTMTINGYQALYGQDIETGSTGTTPTYTADQYVVTHNGVSLLFSFREVQGNDAYLGTASASGAFDHSALVTDFTLLVKSVKFLN